jgi:hypothetical protein
MALGQRNDMFKFQKGHHPVLWAEAIAAPRNTEPVYGY